MNKFIWVRDRGKIEHYINLDHIVRVTKDPDFAYIVLNEGYTMRIGLSEDQFDTYQDVITKIQEAR